MRDKDVPQTLQLTAGVIKIIRAHQAVIIQDRIHIFCSFFRHYNSDCFFQRDLGTGNNGIGQYCMCSAAVFIGAADPENSKNSFLRSARIFDSAMIICMDPHSIVMTEWALNGFQTERICYFGIVRLINIIYHIGKNNDHGKTCSNGKNGVYNLGREGTLFFSFCSISPLSP